MRVESCGASFIEPHYPNVAFCGFTKEPEKEGLLGLLANSGGLISLWKMSICISITWYYNIEGILSRGWLCRTHNGEGSSI